MYTDSGNETMGGALATSQNGRWSLAGSAGPTGRARGLGLFSVGLGMAQLLAPAGMAKLVLGGSNPRKRMTMRLLGVREIVSGLGILSGRKPAVAVSSRVLGDLMDLALLGLCFGGRRTRSSNIIASMAAVAGVTALDFLTARQLKRAHDASSSSVEVKKTITVNREPQDVYSHWRDLSNLPHFMAHLESVEPAEAGRSRWTASGPAGTTFSWEAEIIADEPGSRLAWRSIPGGDVDNAGEVLFRKAPAGQGTEVTVSLSYDPPAGRLGAAFAKLFGKEPGQEIDGDLRRWKQVMETGEVTHSDASIFDGPHAAQPSARQPSLQHRDPDGEHHARSVQEVPSRASSNGGSVTLTGLGSDMGGAR